jgi:hypothetical protein
VRPLSRSLTLNNAFASYALLKAYEAFPRSFKDRDDPEYSGKSNGIPDVLDEVRFATDYLVKLLTDDSQMVIRVGSDADHNMWVTSPYQSTLPENQGGGARPVSTGGKADVAGLAAASLALMSTLYKPYDAALAAQYLDRAKALYDFAAANTGVSTEEYYQDNNYEDDLMCAAVELFRVTGDESYRTKAQELDKKMGSHGDVLCWAESADLCRHSLTAIADADAKSYWDGDISEYLKSISTSQYINGLSFMGDEWGTLQYAMGAAFSTGLMWQITKDKKYSEFVGSQVKWVQGENEYGHSLAVGWGDGAPAHPHHKNAYGRDDLDWLLDQDHLYEIKGALVGGPTPDATDGFEAGYFDDIQDYIHNEVSINYNAMFAGALAAYSQIVIEEGGK